MYKWKQLEFYKNNMDISIKHIRGLWSKASSIIEMTIQDNSSKITFDVTNLKSIVDIDFINNLREIADELEEHNNLINSL